jgi:hypothetical protein
VVVGGPATEGDQERLGYQVVGGAGAEPSCHIAVNVGGVAVEQHRERLRFIPDRSPNSASEGSRTSAFSLDADMAVISRVSVLHHLPLRPRCVVTPLSPEGLIRVHGTPSARQRRSASVAAGARAAGSA